MAEKTEQPTAKRLKEARKKGQIARSNDLTQAFLFLVAAGVLSMAGPAYLAELKSTMIQFFQPSALTGTLPGDAMLQRFGNAALRLLLLSAPLLGALMVGSIAANFVQVRGLITGEAMKPKFEKLNPAQGLKNLFGTAKTYVELAKTLLKFTIIAYLAYGTIRSAAHDVVLSARLNLTEIAALGGSLLFILLFKVAGVFLVFGGADYLIQHKMLLKQLMMSKEEVTREYKQDEGDPHIKHQRRHLHKQMLSENISANVRKAKVVVVNPTHLAIAVSYDENSMQAPVVAAKGQLEMAKRILGYAREYGVPILRNVPLAHSLYAIETEAEIPEDLYEAVAEVLNWVYQLAHMEEE